MPPEYGSPEDPFVIRRRKEEEDRQKERQRKESLVDLLSRIINALWCAMTGFAIAAFVSGLAAVWGPGGLTTHFGWTTGICGVAAIVSLIGGIACSIARSEV
jgi:hypothetical protein